MSKPPPPPPKAPKQGRARPKDSERPPVAVVAQSVDLTHTAVRNQAIFRALMIYIQHPGLSLKKVWETGTMPEAGPGEAEPRAIIDMIEYRTLENHAVSGKWARRREDHWAEVERRVLEEAQSAAVKEQLKELERLQAVAGTLFDHITGANGTEQVKPKTMEGASATFMQIDKWYQSKREKVLEQMAAAAARQPQEEPEDTKAPAAPAIEDTMTDAEVAAMADHILQQRAQLLPEDVSE